MILASACFKLSYNYNGIKEDYGVGYVMGDDIVLDACERGILSTEDFLTENAQYHKLLDEIDPAIIVKSQTDGQLQYFITKKAKDGMTFIRKNYLYYNHGT